MKLKKATALMTVAVMGMSLLAGCSGGSAETEKKRQKQKVEK